MADQTMQEVLDRLKTLQARVAAQEATLARCERRRQRPVHHLLRLLTVALVVALLPLSLLAASPFTDLTGGVHNANIAAIYDAGVTRGCVPDAEYCPTANVTREEMASFLARLGGLGNNPPVAHAKTAETAATALHATMAETDTGATNAFNATQFDGQPASYYQPAGQPIANATNAGNATAVGGYLPSGLLRVARADDHNPCTAVNPVTDAYATVATLALTAPAAGFVLVMAQVSVQHTNATLERVDVRLRDTTSNNTSPATYSLLTQQAETHGLTWVFPVTAGARTFVLEAKKTGLLWGTCGAAITGLYVPFGYDGGTTLAP
jgi:hypothetical protein